VGIPATMRAAVLMGPNRLELREVETPRPGPQDVLIKVNSCALCGSDVSLIAEPWLGQPPYGAFIIQVHSVRREGRANCARAIALMRQRKVDGRPLITHRFPLEAIAEGFRVFTGREGGAIKVLIRP